jgi:sulfoxide reductase heme-binding subunit YedZ
MATKAAAKQDKPLVRQERLLAHLLLASGTVLGCMLAYVYDRSAIIAEPLSVGLGYVALVYLVAGLLVGPLYLARQRRNPVNLYLRRDIGIWAGITALVHVLLSFQLFAGGQVLLYFFRQVGDHYLPQLDLFGLSNDIGLLAAIVIFVLLVLSNDWALRWLKGKRWKRIQQWTYPLAVLAIFHTLGYQLYNERGVQFILALVALTLVVAVAQGIGIIVHRHRARQRTLARGQGSRPNAIPATPPRVAAPQYLTPGGGTPFAPESISRRRFLQLGGATLLGGAAALVTLKVTKELLLPTTPYRPRASRIPASEPPSAQLPTATAVADNPVAAPTATAGDTQAATNPDAGAASAPTPTAPDTTSGNGTGTGAPSGVVLTTLAACPVNSAVTFTAPDTGETGILVHEADGSVKAFSNICTHRPYPVEYDAGSQLLVCPLHYACFNAQNGEVTQGPARQALPPMQVHVDGQGNVVYG